MSNLIRAGDLYAHVGAKTVVVVDTRFDLSNVEAGRRAYEAGHISCAHYLDLEKDLSSQKGVHGGRHPLPDASVFATTCAELGITKDSFTVVYDDATAMFAGRAWWLLRYMLGCSNVKVLDGGYSAWLGANYPVTIGVPPRVQLREPLTPLTTFPKLVDMHYVKQNLENPNVILIDARAADRFRGENETLDAKAGHIPGAVNKPFTENLEGKTFKSPEALRQRFADIPKDKEIILYCGSGVSANHNLLALEEAGITGAKLYAGSWSDWSSYDDNPIETGGQE
ncbi:MAG: sulfurtransferase [Trueperaceae bacterium]